MSIKRREKRRLLQTAALLMRANERVYMGFGQNTGEVMIDALSQSQETAFLLGTDLENTGKADLVPLLETYCEDLYVMSQNLHSKKQMAKLYKKIKKELKLLYDHIENEIEQTVSVLSFFHIKCLCGILWKPSGKRQIRIWIVMLMLYRSPILIKTRKEILQ